MIFNLSKHFTKHLKQRATSKQNGIDLKSLYASWTDVCNMPVSDPDRKYLLFFEPNDVSWQHSLFATSVVARFQSVCQAKKIPWNFHEINCNVVRHRWWHWSSINLFDTVDFKRIFSEAGREAECLVRINVVQLDPPDKGTMVQRQLDSTILKNVSCRRLSLKNNIQTDNQWIKAEKLYTVEANARI